MTRISVIIPAFNAGRFLRQAVDSVRAQDYQDVELVVVDDGSTDDTAVVVALLAAQSPLVRVTHPTNRGLPAARNAGVAASTGRYLAFLDADDWLLPGKLSRQAAFLDGRPEIGLVAGGLELVDEEGRHLAWQRPWLHAPTIDLELLTFVGLVGVHGVLLRRSWFTEVGGFDEGLAYCEDMDLWWRLCAAGCAMAWLPAIEGVYRVHGASMSQRCLEHHELRVALLQRHLGSGLLPAEQVGRASAMVAQWKVGLAGRLFGAGDSAAGAAALRAALSLAPTLRDPDRAAELLALWEQDAWIPNRSRVVEDAFLALPSDLLWLRRIGRRVRAQAMRRRFYVAAQGRDPKALAAAWLWLLLREPGWVMNRGGWSHLFRSLTWRSASEGSRH